MSEIGQDLWEKIDDMFGNPDTTLGVYVNLETDANREHALRYINTCEKNGKEISESEVLLLSLSYD